MMMMKTGGARIGWLNLSWPFAKLHADRDHVEVSTLFGKRYRFGRDEVTLRRFDGVFSRGIQLVHKRPGLPRVIFWTFDRPGVERGLTQRGWSVE